MCVSVLKMTHGSGHQCHAVLIAAVQRVLVPHAATGVGDGLHTRLACQLHRVIPGEREERVTGQHRTLELVPALLEGDADAVDAVGLPAAHAQQAAPLGHRDGIALHVLHRRPSEPEVSHLLGGGLGIRHHRELDVIRLQAVRLLVQPPPADLAQRAAGGGAGGRLQDAQRLALALQLGQAGLAVGGRDHDLVKHAGLPVGGTPELSDLRCKLLIHFPVEGDDAAEGGDGVGPDCEAVGLLEVVPAGDAAGVGVLHHHARRLGVVAHGAVGGVSIQVVVVRHLFAVVLRGSCHALPCRLRQ
mmetsp:Transcript_2095/g.6206  ORF Transcript_2095/g.6206 Transcript_2095/m.6206 type:complete len:301 (+) Transcript_2095:7901-8803(+)